MDGLLKNEPTVSIRQLRKILKLAEEHHKIEEVTFTFLIASCFPNIYENIKEELKRQHAMGYAEGLKDSQK